MTWLRTASRPIHLPDAPYISREDADLIWRADITKAAWDAMSDTQRAELRWNTPPTKEETL